MMKKKITLIIPCYNESGNLKKLISKCNHKEIRKNIEIILVDNGSTDNSYEIMNQNLINIEHISIVKVKNNKGYGYGIISGIKKAKTDFVGWTHADLQTDPIDVIKSIPFIEGKHENIFIKGKRHGRPYYDIFFSICMSIFETILFKHFFWEINAQPTIFHKKFLKKMSEPPHDFSLDLYSYCLAKRNNLKIIRIPVKFSNRLFGNSKWNINFKSKIVFILRTFKYSFKLKRSFK